MKFKQVAGFHEKSQPPNQQDSAAQIKPDRKSALRDSDE
jgi:hypothetical protein